MTIACSSVVVVVGGCDGDDVIVNASKISRVEEAAVEDHQLKSRSYILVMGRLCVACVCVGGLLKSRPGSNSSA